MYPYSILNREMNIFPIFGDMLSKAEFVSMSDDSGWMNNLKEDEIREQKKFQNKLSEVRETTNTNIIISGYLEKRKRMFEILGYHQMVEQERFYHLGLDLSVAKGTQVYCPLSGVIFEVGYEEGIGNYGGYIIIKHEINGDIFYSFYGHVSYKNISLKEGDAILAGDKLGIIGDFDENGGYFHHLHLQIITELGKESGFFSKGYCTKEQIEIISRYTPDPSFLFRY
ncbi:MAG: peptidoglycan DD-metalloendopeptidase family protein [Candidatus Gracilibacteria bacterium]|nr:peptidoglycan DD-metalloendopeptidase family protein [Candidatus Gracilibacteria bacterium]